MHRRNFIGALLGLAALVPAVRARFSQRAETAASQTLPVAYGRQTVGQPGTVYWSRPEPLTPEELQRTYNYMLGTEAELLFSNGEIMVISQGRVDIPLRAKIPYEPIEERHALRRSGLVDRVLAETVGESLDTSQASRLLNLI